MALATQNAVLSTGDILELDSVSGPCVTLHVPAERTGRGRMNARIRLKNMLASIEAEMTATGMRASGVKELLKPAMQLESDASFWKQPLAGLALYLAPGFSRTYALNEPPPELATVSDEFFVRPLLGLLAKPPFFVLALDQSHTRLIHVENGTAHEVNPPDLPHSLSEIVGGEEATKSRQMHSVGPAGRMLDSASHGSGDKGAMIKDQLLRFSQAVDRSLCRHLTGTHAEVILAADQPIADIFRSACRYPDLSKETLAGCPKKESPATLASRAKEVVMEESDAALVSLVARYGEMENLFQAGDKTDEVARAAAEGRVRTLFLKKNGNDPRDLTINRAILDTLRTRGRVFEVSPQAMPTDHQMAALYRY